MSVRLEIVGLQLGCLITLPSKLKGRFNFVIGYLHLQDIQAKTLSKVRRDVVFSIRIT